LKDIQSIGVVGAGQMGQGITQVAATCGLSVICLDTSTDMLEKAKSKTEKNCRRLVEKKKNH